MSDYTPGPWRVGTNGPNGLLTVGTERGLMVAMVAHSIYVPDQAEQARGDARLISAAPDLLAAAEGVLPWLAGINTKGDPDVVDALTNVHGQLAAAIKKAKASRRATTTDAQSVTELDGGHATAILECSSVKTREEIEQEYQNNAENLFVEYGDRIRELAKVRDAALAELDDPMARLIAAAKAWHDNHWLSFGECSHSVCIELRDAIDYAEQRRAQG